MFEEAADKAREHVEVPWDEVRAARVHKRALEAFRNSAEHSEETPQTKHSEEPPQTKHSEETPQTTEQPPATMAIPLKPTRHWLYALAAVAAALLLFLATRDDVRPQAIAWQAASSLDFTDGSRSRLSAQARLHVVQDSLERVEVRQDGGRVRYEIAKRPERKFVVGVRGVTITVLGTVFEVGVEPRQLHVSVTRGRVRVEHQGGRLELTAGQRVTLDVPAAQAGALASGAAAAEEVPAGEAPPSISEEHASNAAPQPTPAPTQADALGEPSLSPHGAATQAGPSAAELLARADAARNGGQLAEAARTLRRLLADHPRDRRTTVALFTLGRVERQRGNQRAAAAAFSQCGTAFQGDALAASAAAWLGAGEGGRARKAAERYLAAYPSGVHAGRMRSLVGLAE